MNTSQYGPKTQERKTAKRLLRKPEYQKVRARAVEAEQRANTERRARADVEAERDALKKQLAEQKAGLTALQAKIKAAIDSKSNGPFAGICKHFEIG
jgi:hypothetical protein